MSNGGTNWDKFCAPYEFHYCHGCACYVVKELVGIGESPICEVCEKKEDNVVLRKVLAVLTHEKLVMKRDAITLKRQTIGMSPLWWRDPQYRWVFDEKGNTLTKGQCPYHEE